MRQLTEPQNLSLRNGPSHNTSGDKPDLSAQHQAAPAQCVHVTLSDTGHELVRAVHAFKWDSVIKTSVKVKPDEWEHLFGFRFDESCEKMDRNILHCIIAEDSKTKDVLVDNLRLCAAEALMERAPDDKTKSNIINKGDYQGKTALHLAVIHRTLPFLKLLLRNGADVNCQDHNGDTPLHYVSLAMHDKSDIVKCLAEQYGANLLVRNIHVQTPLHHTALALSLGTTGSLRKCRDDREGQAQDHNGSKSGIVKCLVEKGVDRLIGNIHGQTPLHYAASALSLDTIRSLRECLDGREADRLPLDHKFMTPADQARCSAWGWLTARKLDGGGEISNGNDTLRAVIAEFLQWYEDPQGINKTLKDIIDDFLQDGPLQGEPLQDEPPQGIKSFEAVIASLLQEEPPQEHMGANSSPSQHELRICSEPTGFCCVLGTRLQPDGVTTKPVRTAFPKPVVELLDGPRPLLKELRCRQLDSRLVLMSPPWLSSWVHLPAKKVCKAWVSYLGTFHDAQVLKGSWAAPLSVQQNVR